MYDNKCIKNKNKIQEYCHDIWLICFKLDSNNKLMARYIGSKRYILVVFLF